MQRPGDETFRLSRHSTSLGNMEPGTYSESDASGVRGGIPADMKPLRAVRRHAAMVAAFVVLSVLGTWLVCSWITPMYESTAVIDLDLQAPPSIIGQDTQRMTGVSNSDDLISTQISIVRSDSVLRPVSEKYKLRELEHQSGFRSDAPITLKQLVVKRLPNTYLLAINYRSPDPQLSADVSNAVAQSYITHVYRLRQSSSAVLTQFMEGQLVELKGRMEKSSQALARVQSELNLVDADQKTNISGARLMQLNQELTDAQGDRIRKEAIYRTSESGTIDAVQISAQGESLKPLIEQENEIQSKFAVAKQLYGARHPEFLSLQAHLLELRRQIDATRTGIVNRTRLEYTASLAREKSLADTLALAKIAFDRLNARRFEFEQLRQEANGDRKLYEDLVRKIKEAGINSGFQNTSIRVSDNARPTNTYVYPKKALSIGAAFVLSLILGLSAAYLSGVLDNSVRTTTDIRSSMNVRALVALPYVKAFSNGRGIARERTELLTLNERSESAYLTFWQSIRTLRHSILLDQQDARPRTLLVTSALPGEGKSSVAAYLAMANALSGQRTLLIDGDLLRPALHSLFGLPNYNGLSNVIRGDSSWRDVVLTTSAVPDLHVLPAGEEFPLDAFSFDWFRSLLDDVQNDYSVVIIDSAPLLMSSESLLAASAVDGVLMVARAGSTNRTVILDAIDTLMSVRSRLLGLILNQVDNLEHKAYRTGALASGAYTNPSV